jgi:hypothetical protein
VAAISLDRERHAHFMAKVAAAAQHRDELVRPLWRRSKIERKFEADSRGAPIEITASPGEKGAEAATILPSIMASGPVARSFLKTIQPEGAPNCHWIGRSRQVAVA